MRVDVNDRTSLFLSPFLFHSKYNEAGLLGFNTTNFVFNVDAQMKRFWSMVD